MSVKDTHYRCLCADVLINSNLDTVRQSLDNQGLGRYRNPKRFYHHEEKAGNRGRSMEIYIDFQFDPLVDIIGSEGDAT